MDYFNPLEYDNYYHIYNRANGHDDLFPEPSDYSIFLGKLSKYLPPVVDLYSYCLLRNHFHLLVKVRSEFEILKSAVDWWKEKKRPYKPLDVSKQFSDCFNSYSKTFNKANARTGSLFQERFRRVKMIGEDKIMNMVGYIHTNAQHHKMVKNFEEWNYSSYKEILSGKTIMVKGREVINWFGGKEQFIQFHTEYSNSILEDHFWLE